MKKTIVTIVLFFFFVLPIRASDTTAESPSELKGPSLIKLRVGDRKFHVSRETLTKFPNSPLYSMFATDSRFQLTTDEQGFVFMDDDSDGFDHILYFLRHNVLNLTNLEDAERLIPVADKILPELVPIIKTWITEHKPPFSANLAAIQMTNDKNRNNWFICSTSDGKIVGCAEYGHCNRSGVDDIIDEYNNRPVHGNLCYAWAGYGYSVYNIETDKQIGQKYEHWENHQYLDNIANFLSLKLIENSIKFDRSRHYICTFNKRGKFSIYDANTGAKRFSKKSFENVAECKSAIYRYAKRGKL